MAKELNSRICFVYGIGLHLRFYTDEEGWCLARFQPKPIHPPPFGV